MPGFWFGLLAILLAAALRRWYDPVPGRGLAAFGTVLLVLFAPVLFGGRLLLPLDNLRGAVPFQALPPTEPHGNVIQGDLIELVAPSIAAAREAWGEGRWPLWNDRVGAGMPLLGDPQAQVLQPFVLAGAPLPWPWAAGVTAALRVFVALVFTFLWLRRQDLGEGPALAGAFAFGLGGFVLLWLGWPLANAAALLPVVLYAVARLDAVGGRRDRLLLILSLLALLLAGHPEAILYVLGLAFAFGVDRARRRSQGLHLIRDFTACLLVAGALAAPALLPALDLLPRSLRAERLAGPAPDSGRSLGEEIALRWLPIAVPNAFGNSRFIHYWGRVNSNEDASGFVGTATLLAALLSVGTRKKFPQEWLALGIAVFCLVAPLTGEATLARGRLLLPLSACLAFLAACTLERFRRGEARRWPVIAVALGLGAVIAWGTFAYPHPEDPERLAVLRFGWLHWQARFLVLATLLLLVAGTRRRWRPVAGVGLALLTAAELLLAHGPVNPPMPRRLAFPKNPVIRFLEKELQARRKGGPGYRLAALGEAFPANLPALYGIKDARFYNPAMPRDYARFVAPLVTGWAGERPLFGNPGHRLYARLGVRYLLTAPGEPLPPPLERVLAAPSAWVWRVPRARPRLFFLPVPVEGSTLRIPRLEAQWITAEIVLPERRRLASNLYQDGGWLLLLDGERRPTRRDGPFLAGGRLPGGELRVDLLYRPRGFVAGMVLAAVGLAAGAALTLPSPILPPHRRERGKEAE